VTITDDMIGIVHTYYPRGMVRDDPRYKKSAEYGRLVAARRQAGKDNEAWRTLLRRLSEQFPATSVLNDSLHLPTGSLDAAYSGKVFLSPSLTVGFLVSFLAPYYVLYSARVVEDLEERPTTGGRARVIFAGRTCYVVPAWVAKLATLFLGATASPLADDAPPKRTVVSFEFTPEEQACAAWLTQEIEAIWGFERMPPEVGKVIVPDVATDNRSLGEATLYDCLFAEFV